MENQESQHDLDVTLDEWLRYGSEGDQDKRVWDWLNWVAVALGVVTVIGIVMLWPTGKTTARADTLSTLGVPSQFYAADVTRVEEAPCAGTASLTCSTVDFTLVAGPDVGFVHTQDFAGGPTTPHFALGQKAVLSYIPANAKIREIDDQPCSFDVGQQCRVLSLVVGEGPDARQVDYEASPEEDSGGYFESQPVMAEFVEGDAGQPELFSVSPVSPYRQYSFADFQRRPVLMWLVLIFAAVVVWLGRWRGTAALGGLVASIAILLLYILPAILDGRSPVLVVVFGSAAIAFIALYMAHGFNRMTTVALIGTVATLLLIALMSWAAVAVSHFTGLVSEESSLLTFFDTVDIQGLLLAGIVLGAAGAIDDVTVTQASAVWELRAANPNLSGSELFRSGLRIGRDHIASMVNTLLLAYAGASLPLVVLFVLSQQSLGSVANSEVVAVEIVRTLVGSIGLVAAVPLTTWLAAITAGSEAVPSHPH
ncbi:MAG: YibE/F family protein [Acidimicrobiia bacterium]